MCACDVKLFIATLCVSVCVLSLSVTVLHCTNWVATSQHFTILMAPTLSLFVSVSLATGNCAGKSAD